MFEVTRKDRVATMRIQGVGVHRTRHRIPLHPGVLMTGWCTALGLLGQGFPALASPEPAPEPLDSAITAQNPVTPVDQLTDVQPTSWAFQSLRSLMERYGCIQGYPDGTFRGEQSATRFEMVAALSACLDQVSANAASQADLAQLKELQDELALMMKSLQALVDSLGSRTTQLEAQQFSTTTKLQGQVILAAQFGDFADSFSLLSSPGTLNTFATPEVGAGTGAPGIIPARIGEPRGTAISRVRLGFNTSFNGSDLLNTVLETGNGGLDQFSALGLAGPPNPFPLPPNIAAGTATTAPRPPLVDLGAVDFAGSGTEVSLYRLAYSFQAAKDLTVTLGSNIYPSDFIDFNSYANNEAQDFSSGFFINNPLIISNTVDAPGGAGIAFDWGINSNFTFKGLYIAASPTIPFGGDNGLFSAPFQASGELEYADAFGSNQQNNFAIRLQYTLTSAQNAIATQNVLGINGELSLGQFGLFGRYGISLDPQRSNFATAPASGNLFDTVAGVDPNTNIQTWMAGLGVKDVLVEGSLLALAIGQPFLVNTTLERYSPQTNFEVFYRFPINENITITPTIMVITNPFNIQAAPTEPDNTIIQGLLRTTFTF